jgi:shikimate dehydrogenase
MTYRPQPEKLYVLGHPISHSKSPALYNAVYEKVGLPWEYSKQDLPTEEEARAFLQRQDFLSINITTPYKPLALEAAHVKAASAVLAQGANVLVNKEGMLLAYNTDGQGCVTYLEREGVAFKDASVVVCGTGPTSLSLLHAVAQAGPAEIILMGRSKQHAHDVLLHYAEQLTEMVGRTVDMPAFKEGYLSLAEVHEQVPLKYGSYETSQRALAEADIILDATPLGMKEGDPAPFDTSLLSARQVVFDVVYGHGETALARAAATVGARFFDGAGMLVGQAVVTINILRDVFEVKELDLSEDELFELMMSYVRD